MSLIFYLHMVTSRGTNRRRFQRFAAAIIKLYEYVYL